LVVYFHPAQVLQEMWQLQRGKTGQPVYEDIIDGQLITVTDETGDTKNVPKHRKLYKIKLTLDGQVFEAG
jgi:hypothetical protein